MVGWCPAPSASLGCYLLSLQGLPTPCAKVLLYLGRCCPSGSWTSLMESFDNETLDHCWCIKAITLCYSHTGLVWAWIVLTFTSFATSLARTSPHNLKGRILLHLPLPKQLPPQTETCLPTNLSFRKSSMLPPFWGEWGQDTRDKGVLVSFPS